MTDGATIYRRICDNLEKVIRGKSDKVGQVVLTLLAGGNLLMEDVPGVGKTTLAKCLARSIRASFTRVQFTPDLLPTDILGSSIYNPRDGSFTFKEGPVFTHILLADEINRASPRTQSSLLEAMSEGQVTIEGQRYVLPDPFVVVATQNPVDFHGTYPLPEAQLDRFTMRLSLGYPPREDERQILRGQRESHPLDALEAVAERDEVLEAQAQVRRVKVGDALTDFMLSLVEATRRDPRLRLGVSPRGTLALSRCVQARALVQGRDYCIPDDVKALAVPVLAHRLLLDTKARYSGVTKEEVTMDLLSQIEVPT